MTENKKTFMSDIQPQPDKSNFDIFPNLNNINNLLIFLSFFSPIIIIFIFTFMGFYFSNFTGLVYLCFVLFSILARFIFYKLSFLKMDNKENFNCDLVNYSNIGYGDIYLSLWVFTFTLFYTIYSALINGRFKDLTAIYIIYLLYFCTDSWTKMKYKCYFNGKNPNSSILHILFNIFSGGLFGLGSIFIVNTLSDATNSELSFFPKQKSHETCKKTTDTMFTCDI